MGRALQGECGVRNVKRVESRILREWGVKNVRRVESCILRECGWEARLVPAPTSLIWGSALRSVAHPSFAQCWFGSCESWYPAPAYNGQVSTRGTSIRGRSVGYDSPTVEAHRRERV